MRETIQLLLAGVLFAALAVGQTHPRIAVGGLSAESNSLYPAKLPMKGGKITREAWLNQNLLASTVASGVIEAAGKLGLGVYPIVTAAAGSLGEVEDASFNARLDELVSQLKDASPRFDGVILILHGAMVVESYPSGDAEVVRRVRQAMGREFPIVVTNDFHANVDPALVRDSNVLITFKEDPHLDTKERGIQAATIIAGMVGGKLKPVQYVAKPPMVWNILFQDTFHGYLKPIVEEERRLERTNPKILAVSVPAGYQYADVPWMGPSVVVVTNNDPALAKSEAERLGNMLWELRSKLVFDRPDAAAAVAEAMRSTKFPVALMDTGDNIGGGSPGDSTFILSELLRQKATGWVVVISDRAAAEAAFRAGVGQRFEEEVGGKTDKMHGDPVRVAGRVKALTDGQYVEPEVRHGGGRYEDMGPTAVIEAEGSTRDLPNLLLLTTHPTSPDSLNQLISNGVYPRRERILVAKGTIAPRAAYEPVAARIIEVNTPGATDVNPAHFTYHHVRPNLYGLGPEAPH